MYRLLTFNHRDETATAIAYFNQSVLDKLTQLATGAGTIQSLSAMPAYVRTIGSSGVGYITLIREDRDANDVKLGQSVDEGASYSNTILYPVGTFTVGTSRIKFDRTNPDVGWAFAYSYIVSDLSIYFNQMGGCDGTFGGSAPSSWSNFHADDLPIKVAITQNAGVGWSISNIAYGAQLLPVQINGASGVLRVVSPDEGDCTSVWGGFMQVDSLVIPMTVTGYKLCFIPTNIWGTDQSGVYAPLFGLLVAPLHDGSNCYLVSVGQSYTNVWRVMGNYRGGIVCPADVSTGRTPVTAPAECFIFKVNKDGSSTYWRFFPTTVLAANCTWISGACTDPTQTSIIWAVSSTPDNPNAIGVWQVDFDGQIATFNDNLGELTPDYDYVDVCVTDNGTVLVYQMDGTNDPPTYLYVHRSPDGGTTWTTIDLSAYLPTFTYFNFQMEIGQSGIILFHVGERVLWSSDNGASWDYTAELTLYSSAMAAPTR